MGLVLPVVELALHVLAVIYQELTPGLLRLIHVFSNAQLLMNISTLLVLRSDATKTAPSILYHMTVVRARTVSQNAQPRPSKITMYALHAGLPVKPAQGPLVVTALLVIPQAVLLTSLMQEAVWLLVIILSTSLISEE
jgi:hypothetical protein